MKLISKENPLETLRLKPVEERTKMMKQYTDGLDKVKDLRTESRETVKVFGKLACLAEIDLNTAIKANVFPANKSLASYIEDLTGQKPANHGLTLKNAFGSFVIPGHITENDYDINSSNCLELAARIVTAVKGDLTHVAVQLAIAELKERGEKEAANLRDLLAGLKPSEKLTATEALTMLAQIRADGQLGVLLVQLPDEMLLLAESDQRSAYLSLAHTVENVNRVFGAKADAWIVEQTKNEAPVTETRAGVPVLPKAIAPAAPNTAAPTAPATPAAPVKAAAPVAPVKTPAPAVPANAVKSAALVAA